ncbi:hypothetical protein Tco_0246421 [Tanacetum coccineum]
MARSGTDLKMAKLLSFNFMFSCIFWDLLIPQISFLLLYVKNGSVTSSISKISSNLRVSDSDPLTSVSEGQAGASKSYFLVILLLGSTKYKGAVLTTYYCSLVYFAAETTSSLLFCCLPTELKELPSKVTELSKEIKELKQHVKDMELELPEDLQEIPSKIKTFTSTISSLLSQVAKLENIQWVLLAEFLDLPHLVSSVQEKLKTLDSLPGLLNKVTNTLNRFATLVGNALGAIATGVPSADKATASPAKGEKDVDTNLKNELVDLLGINIVTQYYNKKLLYEKYSEKMKKRRQSSKIINYDVLTKKGSISLKVYREDETAEVIEKFKAVTYIWLNRER